MEDNALTREDGRPLVGPGVGGILVLPVTFRLPEGKGYGAIMESGGLSWPSVTACAPKIGTKALRSVFGPNSQRTPRHGVVGYG